MTIKRNLKFWAKIIASATGEYIKRHTICNFVYLFQVCNFKNYIVYCRNGDYVNTIHNLSNNQHSQTATSDSHATLCNVSNNGHH